MARAGDTAVRERDPVRTLGGRVAVRATGIFTVQEGKLRRLFCLERGRLVHAASNLIEEQFDEVLVREGKLGAGERAGMKVAAREAGMKIGPYLREHGPIGEVELDRDLERHFAKLLAASLESRNATCSFADGKPNLSSELTSSVNLVPIVIDACRTAPRSTDEVRVRIGPPGTILQRSDEVDRQIEHAFLSETARTTLDRIDGRRDVSALLEVVGGETGEDTEAILRTVYGLQLCGVVRATVDHSKPSAPAGETPVTRDEAEARIALADRGNYYEILGVGQGAELDEIRRGYYTLARRFHPDRFRTGALQGLRPQIERYFSRVTEAHNTLSDPGLRRQYDEELNEKTAGKKKDEQDSGTLARQNFMAGKAAIAKKQLQSAVTFFENAIELDPSKAEYHFELGSLLAGNPRRRDDAEQALNKSVELDPTLAKGYAALGSLFVRMRRTDEAIAMYRECLRWDPANAEATTGLAELGAKA